MSNDEINWNEENENAKLDRLLDKICGGVEVPSDEDSENAYNQQH